LGLSFPWRLGIPSFKNPPNVAILAYGVRGLGPGVHHCTQELDSMDFRERWRHDFQQETIWFYMVWPFINVRIVLKDLSFMFSISSVLQTSVRVILLNIHKEFTSCWINKLQRRLLKDLYRRTCKHITPGVTFLDLEGKTQVPMFSKYRCSLR
jgi:hypothetical protein